MNSMNKSLFEEHARRCFPAEACGLLLVASGKEEFFPCRNIAKGQNDFIMSPEDYAAAEDSGDILAVLHSHPNSGSSPSQADLVGCEGSGLPWFIFSIPGATWAEMTPSGYRAPYVGRVFSHGVLDCYTLIQDWYRQELKISLPDFNRKEEWWKNGDDLYLENFQSTGFRRIDPSEMTKGDIILMQIHSRTVNHGAIYLGNDVILHHVMNRLSCRETYGGLGGYFKKNTRLIVRHESK